MPHLLFPPREFFREIFNPQKDIIPQNQRAVEGWDKFCLDFNQRRFDFFRAVRHFRECFDVSDLRCFAFNLFSRNFVVFVQIAFCYAFKPFCKSRRFALDL